MNYKITALKVQKRNPQRVNIYLDGDYAFGLTRLKAAWLHIGQELTDEKIVTLQSEDEHEVAYQGCLKYLDYRVRSENEIYQYLINHKFTEEIIQTVIERLRQSKLVDDTRFAQTWVENRSEFRPRSRRALAMEMRHKGIADELITEALEKLDDEGMAYQAALKHAGKLDLVDRPEFRRKMSGFLARRGFSYTIIAPVVDRVWTKLTSNQPAGDPLFYENEEEIL